MGYNLSIDKYTSSLDDILAVEPSAISIFKFNIEIKQTITQHLKIWKFYEDPT